VQGRRVGPSREVIGRFAVGAALNIQQVSGSIIEYLDCDPVELQGYGWRPFLHPDDRDEIAQMAEELHYSQAGAYECRAQARCGEPILHLRIRTLIVQAVGLPPAAKGVIDLRAVESRRTILLP
jgi:PAS domain-containing protein